ncbi:MAG: hypothetical protein AVDCRST_MAG52-791, partial [uncultured Blastococcus sp.]
GPTGRDRPRLDRADEAPAVPHSRRPGGRRRRGRPRAGRRRSRPGGRRLHRDGSAAGAVRNPALAAAPRRPRGGDRRRGGVAGRRLAGRAGVPGARRGHRREPRPAVAAPHRDPGLAGDHCPAGARLDGAALLRGPARALDRADGGAAARLRRSRRDPDQRRGHRPQRRRDRLRPAVGPGRADRLQPAGRRRDRPPGQADRCGQHPRPAAHGAGLRGHRVQRVRSPDGAGRRRPPPPAGRDEPVHPGHPQLPAGEHRLRCGRGAGGLDRAVDHRHPRRRHLGPARLRHELRAQHRLRPGRRPTRPARSAGRWLGRSHRRRGRVLAAELRHPDAHPAPVRRRLGGSVDDGHLHRAAVLELGAGGPRCPAGDPTDPAGQGPPGRRRSTGAVAGRAAARGAPRAAHDAGQAAHARPPVGAGLGPSAAPPAPGPAVHRCPAGV